MFLDGLFLHGDADRIFRIEQPIEMATGDVGFTVTGVKLEGGVGVDD